MSAAIYFVSGIDTEIGKTYATGFLAKLWTAQGQELYAGLHGKNPHSRYGLFPLQTQ